MVDIVPKIQALFLLPPGIIIVIALLGFLIQIRWLLAGSLIVFSSVAALLVLSLPLTGYQLMQGIESRFPPLRLTAAADTGSPPGAIVILGGGRYTEALEYGDGDSVNRLTLERLRYGAHLHRLTGLPILVSGGAPYGEQTPEAELMQASLVSDFRVEVKWVENKSANTHENARYTKMMLAEAGVRRVYLVTHAAHMPRAVWSFENQGIGTIPAPTGFTTLNKEDRETLGYFPSAYGLQLSSSALRERLGLFWYERKYGNAVPAPEAAPAPAR
ncbi:MAG: YdcF family protein [Gammaproteobacteria bacterium]|nr:YdcF family protein [Gammaproteobacteria bacterium]